jgi:hypothetical protein
MATKQFKIGEYVVGGIIQVTTNKNQIEINFNDYFSKKTILSETFNLTSNTLRSDIMNFIEDNGTHYYADQVMKWIESKVDIKPHSYFPSW